MRHIAPLLLLLFAGAVFAEDTFAIHGEVTDNSTEFDAFVYAIGQTSPSGAEIVSGEALVGADGTYVLEGLEAGSYRVMAEVFRPDSNVLLAQGEHPNIVTLGPSAEDVDIALLPVEGPPPAIVGEVIYQGGQSGPVTVTLHETAADPGRSQTITGPGPWLFDFPDVNPGEYVLGAFLDANADGAWSPGEPRAEASLIAAPADTSVTLLLVDTPDAFEPDNSPDTASEIFSNHPQAHTFHAVGNPALRVIDVPRDFDFVHFTAGPGLAEFATYELTGGIQPVLVLESEDGTILGESNTGALVHSFAENTRAVLSLRPSFNHPLTGSYVLQADYAAPIELFVLAGLVAFEHNEPQLATVTATDAAGVSSTVSIEPNERFVFHVPAGTYSVSAILADGSTAALPAPVTMPPGTDDLRIVFDNVPADAYEPDNDAASATPIANGESQAHTLHGLNATNLGDSDYLVIHAFAGPVHALFESGIPLALALFDAAGNELPQIVSDAAREDSTIPIQPFWYVEAEGDYFLRVSARNASDVGRYHLGVEFNDEPLFIAGIVAFEDGLAEDVQVMAQSSNGVSFSALAEVNPNGVSPFRIELPPGVYDVHALRGNTIVEFPGNPVSVPPNTDDVRIVFGIPPDAYEPDNSPGEAKPIGKLELQSHSIHQGALTVIDVDHVVFYAFPGIATADIVEATPGLELGLHLFDAAGNEVPRITDVSRESPPIEFLPLWEIPTAGDYILRIEPVAGSQGFYAIKLDFNDGPEFPADDFEPDNDAAHATPIADGEEQTHTIHAPDPATNLADVDYLAIHAFAGPVYVHFESSLPIALALFDFAGNELPQIATATAREDGFAPIGPFWYVEAEGDYFLRVSALNAGDVGRYHIKLEYNDEPLFIAGIVAFEDGQAEDVFVLAEGADGTVAEVLAQLTPNGIAPFRLELPAGTYNIRAIRGNRVAEFADNPVHLPPSTDDVEIVFAPYDCDIALPLTHQSITPSELANLPIPLPAAVPFIYHLSITNSGGFSGGPIANPFTFKLCLGEPPLALAASALGLAPHVAMIGPVPDPNQMVPLAPIHQDLTAIMQSSEVHLFAETDAVLLEGVVTFDIWFATFEPIPELHARGFAQTVAFTRYEVVDDPIIAGSIGFEGRAPQPVLVQALENGVVVAEVAVAPDANATTGMHYQLQVPPGSYHVQAVIGEESAEFAGNPVVVPPSAENVDVVFGPKPVEPDEYEPNDTLATASPIANATAQQHSIHATPNGVLDIDYVVFHAFPGDVYAHLLEVSPGLHLSMSLFDAAGNELPMIVAEPTREDFNFIYPFWQIQAEGDYTLCLSPIAGNTGPGYYGLKLEFADSASTAEVSGQIQGVNQAQLVVWDAFTDGPPIAEQVSDANGAFSFELPSPGTYVIEALALNEVLTATVAVPPDATNLLFDFNREPVPVTLTAPPVSETSPIPVGIIFARPMQGLEATDLLVENGSVESLQVGNAGYHALITPADFGPVTLTVPAGVAQDAQGVPNAAGSITTHYLFAGCDFLPGWEPPVGVQNTMTVHAQVFAHGQLVDAPGSLLAAFQGTEVRGVAEIAIGPAGPWFQLSIGSNLPQEDGLSLVVFDANSCEFCDVPDKITFVADTTLGAIDDPLPLLACELTQEIALVQGWNWLSFNVAPADPTLDAALQLNPVASDHMEFKTAPHLGGVATFFGGSWIGMPNGINCGQRYLLFADFARTLTVAGQPCEGSIDLVSGWNWLGYTPQEPLPVNVALANFAASNGDELKTAPHLGGTWTYFDGQWFGQDVDLQPGVGYLLRSANQGELVYNRDSSIALPIVTPNNNTVSRAAPDWTPPVGVQNTMTVHATVTGVTASGSKLAVFKDGEVRGVADLINGPGGAQFILSVGSNLASESGLTYAVYDAASDSVCDISQALDFAVDSTVGLINDPISLSCEIVLPLEIVDVQPNPLEIDENGAGTVAITAVNAAGDLSWSIAEAPAQGTATVSAGIASYVPTANYHGTDDFVVLVSDGVSSAVATVSVIVIAGPEPPSNVTVAPAPVIVNEDGVITITVTAEGDALSWTNTEPSNGSFQPQILRVLIFNPGEQTYVYAPNPNFNGNDSFSVTVSNDGGSATANIAITVLPVNDPPENTVAPSISGDLEVGATLLADPGTWNDDRDLDPGNIGFAYQWQVLSDGEDDIEDATSDSLVVGDDLAGRKVRVVVMATDGEGNSAATAVANSAWVEIAEIVVNPLDLTATPALEAEIVLNEGAGSQVFSVAVEANNPEIIWWVDGAAVASGPSFTYTPGFDAVAHPGREASGLVSCSVNTTPNRAASTLTWANVRVVDVDRLPPLPSIRINPEAPDTEDDLVVEILEQLADPDGDPIDSYAISWTLLGNARQAFSGAVLAASETQKHNVWEASVRPITNPYGEVDTATVDATLSTVAVQNSVPEAGVLDTVITGSGAPVDITLDARDADILDTLSYIVDDLPDNGSLVLVGDTVTYTPAGNYLGEDSFSYRVSDGESQSESVVVDIMVAGWLLPIAATESQVEDLLIGMHGLASDGFDVGVDSISPPGGQDTATVGFEGDAQLLSADLRAVGDEADWVFTIDASSAIEEVVISWNTDAVPTLGLFLEEVEGELSLDMRAVNQFSVAAGEVRSFAIHYGVVEFTLHLREGWSIVSVPVLPLDTSVEAVLGATGGAWEWHSFAGNPREDDPTGEFLPATHILPKRGYFVLSGEARDVLIRGSIVSDAVTPLQRHWTLFGVSSAPPFAPRHPAASLDPGDLEIQSHIWRWNGRRYRRSLRLHAGIGYWVYSDFPFLGPVFREAAPGR